jgi:hypothetical protein
LTEKEEKRGKNGTIESFVSRVLFVTTRTILIDFVFKRNVKTRALKRSLFALLLEEEEDKEEAFSLH